jgi:hypothetical protein
MDYLKEILDVYLYLKQEMVQHKFVDHHLDQTFLMLRVSQNSKRNILNIFFIVGV